MVVDQYAFVPAHGGVLTVDGALPHVEDDWEVASLLALLPPTRFLRVAAHVALDPEHVLRLRAFEPVDAPGTRPDDADVPAPLRDAFEQCVAELLRGAPVPELRPLWARPGWHEQAEAWAGMPLEQVRSWPLSYIARNGDIWFKAVFPLFHAEPAITQAIGKPRVLRADHQRGLMLLEHVDGEPASDHHAAVRELARIQNEWSGRADELLALGAQDRRRPTAVPYTLLHGDFHPGNVLGSTIIDWSDAAVGNPLYDVAHYLLNIREEKHDELLDTYGTTRDAVNAVEAEAYEDVALSYKRITDALAPDDRWWFAGEEARWLARATDVREGRRPSRDT